MLDETLDWVAWASRLNQLSLLPFLAFLWTLWRIPSAPKRTVQGWTFYLAFIAVAIPAGIYCRQELGTSMANVDWVHGPCEALLTTANLLIVLGLRDALRTPPAEEGAHNNLDSSSSSSSDHQSQAHSTINCSDQDSLPWIGVNADDTSITNMQRHLHPSGQVTVGGKGPLGPWAKEQPTHEPTHSTGLAVEGPKVVTEHQLPSCEHKHHKRGPGILRAQLRRCTVLVGHGCRQQCMSNSMRVAP